MDLFGTSLFHFYWIKPIKSYYDTLSMLNISNIHLFEDSVNKTIFFSLHFSGLKYVFIFLSKFNETIGRVIFPFKILEIITLIKPSVNTNCFNNLMLKTIQIHEHLCAKWDLIFEFPRKVSLVLCCKNQNMFR